MTEEYLKFILIVDSVEVVTEKALNPYIRDYVFIEPTLSSEEYDNAYK